LGLLKRIFVTDVANWPKPDWFRLKAFPFVGVVDTHFEKWTAAFYPSLLLASVLGSVPILIYLDIDTLFIVARYFLPGWWLAARMLYAIVERAFWERWLAHCVQQRWAATFHRNHRPKDLLTIKSPTRFFAVWTHIPIFLFGIGILACAWVYPAYRFALIWFSVTVSAEPLFCLCFTEIMELRQKLEKDSLTDPFPFRPGLATILIGAGAVPVFSLMVKDLFFTGPWAMEGIEWLVFEASLFCWLAVCLGCGLWATGLQSVLYLTYRGRVQSQERDFLEDVESGKVKTS
jgi:hypothetical protein